MSRLYSLIIAAVIGFVIAGQAIAEQEIALQPALEQDIAFLQTEWARIRYHVPDDAGKLKEYGGLEEYAARVSAAYPHKAEPKIWEAIILSSEAGVKKGLSSLRKVNRAKELLEAALAIDENALNGSAHTSLGSLYYQVPGWPLAFGSNEKAEQHLKAALAINPDGIDPNYFYGDYLLSRKMYNQAAVAFTHALEAPPRPGRELADAGRRQEIKAALAEVRRIQPDAVNHMSSK